MIASAWLAVALAVAGTPAPAPATGSEKTRRPVAMVYVTDEGCVAASGQPDRAEWLDDRRAVYHLHLMLNSRERIHEGPVDIDLSPGKVVAYVPVQVTEPAAGEPVPTCLRPVTLQLAVDPIERGSYDWQFRRGTRAEATAREAQARAKASGRGAPGGEPAPEAGPVVPKG